MLSKLQFTKKEHYMRAVYLKLFTMFWLTIIIPSVVCANNLNPSNNELINNFRKEYLSQLGASEEYVKTLIDDRQKVKDELINMYVLDQKARNDVLLKIEERCQKQNLDCTQDYKQADILLEEVDTINFSKLKLFMQKYTWFKKSEFGEDGAQAAWCIVQHASDLDLQIKVLFIMDYLAKNGEANGENYALLYDRVALNYKDFGLKQRYGSQFSYSEDRKKLVIEPCEGSTKQTDKRRKELGLTPLKEYANILAEMNHITEIVM